MLTPWPNWRDCYGQGDNLYTGTKYWIPTRFSEPSENLINNYILSICVKLFKTNQCFLISVYVLIWTRCRYCRTIKAGWRITNKTDDETVQQIYHDQNDACMLRLFEAFLESAPQSLLQLYIIVCTHDQNWFSGEWINAVDVRWILLNIILLCRTCLVCEQLYSHYQWEDNSFN